MSDAILEKVRKLLAKAESPACSPAEAEALTDKAAELIAKYGVDRALLAATSPDVDPLADRRIMIHPPYALDKAGLFVHVASPLRCRTVRRKQQTSTGYAYAMHLFGFTSDLDRVELVYTSLLVQASMGLAATPVPEWDSPAAFRRTWLAGFAYAVGQRLRLAEERAAATPVPSPGGPSVALVLADRGERVERRVEQEYPHLRPAQARRLVGSGMEHGYAAGQQADLGTTRLARPSRHRLAG
jgi:hypothetical protein